MTTKPSSQPMQLRGRRVTVVGLGRFGGGIGAVRWLCGQGASVTVSDKADRAALADSIAQLADCDVELHLGGHDEADFVEADLLVVSPAVPPDLPPLQAAAAAGVARTTEINLLLQRCEARVVGITGSVGKSTTTAMTGEILGGAFTAHVGGNIGGSLLEALETIAPDHVVVMELSSFQLADLPQVAISPTVAVVTNLQPNHLDRHGDMASYAAAKKNIFAFQRADDVLVLNRADPVMSDWAAEAPGKVEWFDPTDEPFDLIVPGLHNQANAQAAWAAARQFGVARDTAAAALKGFSGLPHRLQFVVRRDGMSYVNDSKCTTPAGTIVAMEAFGPRGCIVIVGGSDKGIDFDNLGAALAGRAKGVVTMGPTGPAIAAAVEAHRTGDLPIVRNAPDLAAAVEHARKLASADDIVLLSPACASFDQFDNYERRGEAFVRLVTA